MVFWVFFLRAPSSLWKAESLELHPLGNFTMYSYYRNVRVLNIHPLVWSLQVVFVCLLKHV